MTFGREKRIHLARLALLAPLPLPFNEVVGWGEMAAFWLAVGLCIFRAGRGLVDTLPKWALNLLGLAYLPLLLLEMRGVRGGEVLHPLAHLVLYTLAVKLFALRHERDKWHAFLAIFFLFLASIGSSVHPTVLVYLLVFMTSSIYTLSRFAGYDLLSRPGSAAVRHVVVPIKGVVGLMAVLVVVGSIPVFVLMPRIRQPYVFSRLGSPGQASERNVFQDTASLDSVGRVRSSREVVLRFRYDGRPSVQVPRLRSAAYDLFDGTSWRRSETPQRNVGRGPDGAFHLSRDPSLGAMELWLRTGGVPRLVLPVEATRLQAPAWHLLVNGHGEVQLPIEPNSTVAYRAELGRIAGKIAVPLPAPGPAGLDRGGLTPRIEELARSVMGTEGGALERATRLENHLRDEYGYTVDLGSGGPGSPVERFLFDTRRGYCEYFASAMVLMLRAEGVPARYVLGYLGAEKSRLEDYYIVRDRHAHAWVEAYLPERGWMVFDPTPPLAAGGGISEGLRALLEQAYDYMLFRWDRYVLTYSFTDQVGLFIRMREAWRGWWESFRPERQAVAERPARRPETADRPQEREGERDWDPGPWRAAPAVLAVATLAGWLWWRRRSFGAASAYLALRRELSRRGEPPLPSTPPLEVGRRLMDSCPDAGEETRRVLDFYLRESYRGEKLRGHEIEDLRATLRRARAKYRRSA